MTYQRDKDVIPFVGSDEEVDVVLFITDGKSEPKKINVRRCIDGDEYFTGNALQYGSGTKEMKDFLEACSRVPLAPIEFSFDTEVDLSGNPIESSFEGTNGLQFCYQLIYKDGFVSAISPFSDVAYPTAVTAMGVNTLSSLDIQNVCNLVLPGNSNALGPSSEVRRVRILFREGNEGVLKLIDEVSLDVEQSNPNWSYQSRTYSFRNNEVYGVVSNSVLNKNFDHLPKKAISQTVSDDRLMYGGYTEGFDNVVTSTSTTVLFNDRVTRLIGSEINLEMVSVLSDEARGAAILNDNDTTLFKKQINSGFKIDFSEMPSSAEAGIYDIRVNVRPKQNFHIFNSQSFYGLGFGYFNGSSGTKWPSGIINADNYSTSGYSGGTNSPKSDDLPSASPVGNAALPTAGNPEHGVFTSSVKWRAEGGTELDEEWTCGTSPTNPLIIKGGLVSFRVAFEVTSSITKNLFVQLFDIILRTGAYSGEIDGLPTESVVVFTSPGTENGVVFDMHVDLGLGDGDSFDADSDLANLISHFADKEGTEAIPNGLNNFNTRHGGFANFPLAYFIVNRANYSLRLDPLGVEDGGTYPSPGSNPLFSNGSYSSDVSNNLFYRFSLESFSFPSADQFNGNPFSGDVPGTEGYWSSNPGLFGNIMTCIPMPKEGFGVQTVVAIDDDGKEHIGFPYQGPSYLADPTGNDFYIDERWRKGEIDFLAFADGVNADWPGVTQNAENEYITDQNNWSYYSVPLMPFCIGRVKTTGSAEGLPEYRWPIIKTVSGTNVPNSNIAHPSYNGLGVKASDTTYADFKNYDSANFPTEPINEYGRIQGGDGPAPIGKWIVYSNEGINADKYLDDFSFNAEVTLKRCTDHNGWLTNKLGDDNKFSGQITFRATHPTWWLPFPFDNPYTDGNPYVSGYGSKWLNKVISFELSNKKNPSGSYAFSVVDGAAGPGGGFLQPYSDEVAPTYNPGDTVGDEANGEALPVSNRKGSVRNTTLIGICDNMPFLDASRKYAQTTSDSFDDRDVAAGSFEDVGTVVSIINESTDVEGSFKSNDIHNFGIVYYDEKGRASSVYRINNVYVPGYSDSERGAAQKGSVDVEIELFHDMPSWARSYQIVYGGSSNTRRFLQFFAGGAFTEVGASGTQDDKIYVSLNYLQGSKISYTKAFGAKDQDTGEPVLYRYSEGDKLRIISSFVDDSTVEYHPASYVFDIIGVEEISELQDVNPLLSDEENYNDVLRRTGSFLVLRNNISASGFDAQKVSLGTSRWGDRALVEVITPKKTQDEDRIPYFETGVIGVKGAPVGSAGPHVPSKVTVDSGDVFFRVVPNNTREYIAGQFVDLIESADNKDEDASKSRFRGYYMESSSVSDLFRSQAKSYGRIHYTDEEASENFNEASIIYGDKNLSETYRPKITSFPSRANFLDLPKKYGGIDYLYDTGANIIALQETKVSDIQVNKSITTVAGGGENLALSRNVLNDPRYYGPDLGSSKRPESITIVDNEIYFVDRDKKTIGLITSGGIKTISGGTMSRFFDEYFNDIVSGSTTYKPKFSTGYNPRTNEFIISKYSDGPLNGLDPDTSFGRIFSDSETNTGVYNEGDVFYGMNDSNPTNKKGVWPYTPTTLSYSIDSDSWKTFYSFRSNRYEYVDTTFVSIFNEGQSFVWRHNEEGLRNNFYGRQFASYFNSFVNDSPSTTHLYTSLSVEGSSPWNLVLSTDNELTQVTNFVKKEGTFYSDIPRTERQGGSSHIKTLGTVQSVEDISGAVSQVKITFSNNVGGYTFNVGNLTSIYAAKNGNLIPFAESAFSSGEQMSQYEWQVTSISNRDLIATSATPTNLFSTNWSDFKSAMEGSVLYVRSVPRFYGDPLRDKYLKIEAIKAPSEDELISINIEATPSNLDSSM